MGRPGPYKHTQSPLSSWLKSVRSFPSSIFRGGSTSRRGAANSPWDEAQDRKLCGPIHRGRRGCGPQHCHGRSARLGRSRIILCGRWLRLHRDGETGSRARQSDGDILAGAKTTCPRPLFSARWSRHRDQSEFTGFRHSRGPQQGFGMSMRREICAIGGGIVVRPEASPILLALLLIRP
jgi:hypothetical protein